MVDFNEEVIITGWHSGTNPSPGLGVARSIHSAYPSVRILALDYSDRATGLEHQLAHETLILPRWGDSDPALLAKQISDESLRRNAPLISCLDLESRELSNLGATNPLLLVPPPKVFKEIVKPAAHLASALNLEVPRSVVAANPLQSERFLASMGWPVWVKGRNYEALLSHNNAELRAAITYIKNTWGEDPILQEYLTGVQYSIAFAAWQGELLGACLMSKKDTTDLGKVWCGRISPVDCNVLARLKTLVVALGWTGGGEIEMIRELGSDKEYLLDFNPRFPAWIYGATLAGVNLPAALFAASRGRKLDLPGEFSGGFVRAVVELPTKRYMWDLKPEPVSHTLALSKTHPSGMPELARAKVHNRSRKQRTDDDVAVEPELQALLNSASECEDGMPVKLFLDDIFVSSIDKLNAVADRLSKNLGIHVQVAYSVKTNPCHQALAIAQNMGLFAETISLAEYLHALKNGFSPKKCILNGPGKWWPIGMEDTLPAPCIINCDSPEDIIRTQTILERQRWDSLTIGIRFATIASRFGVNIEDCEQFCRLCDAYSKLNDELSYALHFHFAQSMLGIDDWERAACRAISGGETLQLATNKKISILDIGGGWSAELDSEAIESALFRIGAFAKTRLPELETIIVEPGKWLVQRAGVVRAIVLEVRDVLGKKDLITSASIAELPDCNSHMHRIAWRDDTAGAWRYLGVGGDQISGRICMESDVLRKDVFVPDGIKCGDAIAFLDAGAYDSSMAFSFGRGQ